MGVDLVLLACDRACATAPNQGSDVFERTLMPSPRNLRAQELAGTMRYTLASPHGESALALPDTDEQRVEVRGKERVVTISRNARARVNERPAPEDFRPNDWLQSDAPDIVRLARQAAGDAGTPLERMILRPTRANILLRDDETCQYCGRRQRDLTLDHVLPRSRGGQSTWENLVACCRACNGRKGNRLPKEVGMPVLR